MKSALVKPVPFALIALLTLVLPTPQLKAASGAGSSNTINLDSIYDLPTFDLGQIQKPRSPQKLKAALSDSLALGKVRVLVFPHLGKYAVPQGRESTPDKVTLRTTLGASTCKLLRADLAGNPNDALEDVNAVDFNASTLAALKKRGETRVLQCNSSVIIEREAKLKSYTYSGAFWIRSATAPNGAAIVEVINVIDFDEYLKGVVPTEVPASWPAEVLKAQAIAARTYAEFTIRTNRESASDIDLDDTVSSQAYVGVTKQTPATDAAVDATRGIVMTSDGAVIVAYFSSDAGGYTESAKQVWPEVSAPYCVSKPEQYPTQAGVAPWTVELSRIELSERLRASGLIDSSAIVNSVRILDRNESGRATRVALGLQKGTDLLESKEVLATDFRYSSRIRSTLFNIESTSNGFKLTGKGYGHGAGMAQEGARIHHVTLGWDAEKILKFYYEGIQLRANVAP